jgi:hypothetical protein
MGSLSNLYISQSYQSLTHLGTNNALVPGTMTQLQDGIGQSLNISFDGTNISSSGNIFAANITGSGASINTGSFATTASFNSYTASTNIRLNNLELNSGSVNISISNLNSTTASQGVSITNINSATASLFTSASRAIVTASVNLNTITFTKGDASTFAITVNTGSGGGGGTTDTGSLMVTGSIAGNILTFTKGDASTFNLTIPSATGSIFDTGSFATTGSNTFVGKQTINEELLVNVPRNVSKEFRINWGNASSASMFTEESGGPSQTLVIISGTLDLRRGGIDFTSGNIRNSGDQIQFNAYPSASFY